MRGRIGARDLVLALVGAAVALAGLALLDDVGTASWIVAPVVAAAMLPIHVRFLLAGDGPLRT